jgi:hypothetical protein
LKGHTDIAGSMGSTPDGIQFSSGPVILGWNLSGSDQLQYALIDGTNFQVSNGPWTLTTPKGREPGVLSITKDDLDHAIATWGDAEQSDYLCYALINPDGAVVTPPMIFVSGQGQYPTLDTNAYGLGNAEYLGTWLDWLPLLER